jgi:rod shape-determining protein MreD
MFETLAESSLIRTALILTAVLGVQTSLLAEVRPFGGIVDLVALLAAMTGLVAGPRRGARAAFLFGVGFDLLIATPFGIKGLAYGLSAFAVGMLPAEPIRNLRFLVPIIAAGGAALATLTEGVVAAIFGRSEAISRYCRYFDDRVPTGSLRRTHGALGHDGGRSAQVVGLTPIGDAALTAEPGRMVGYASRDQRNSTKCAGHYRHRFVCSAVQQIVVFAGSGVTGP